MELNNEEWNRVEALVLNKRENERGQSEFETALEKHFFSFYALVRFVR